MTPYIKPGTLPISENRIINIVCELSGIYESDIKGKSKKRGHVIPRHVAIHYIHRIHPEFSLEQIGWIFNRDHSTMSNALMIVGTVIDKNMEKLMMKVGDEINRITNQNVPI